MEESKELQGFYKIFRTVVYVSVLLEFFEYAIDPAMPVSYTHLRPGINSPRRHASTKRRPRCRALPTHTGRCFWSSSLHSSSELSYGTPTAW